MSDAAIPISAATATTTKPPRGRLFVKYVGVLMAVVAAALIASGGLEIWFSYKENREFLVRIQREQADAAATKIGQFVKEIEGQLGWTTQLPWSAATLDQRRFDALRLLRQVPAVTELAQLDARGLEQLRVSRLAMDVVSAGTDLSKDPRFTEAVAKKVYYGPVYFRRESEPYMTLAVAGNRRDAGVSVAEVNLKFIWDVVSQIKVGKGGAAYVIDGQGRLIAHPDISLVLRNTDLARLAQVKAAIAGAPLDPDAPAVDATGREVLTAHAAVPGLGWFVFVELPLAEALAPIYASIARTGVLLLLGLAIALAAGLLLTRKLVGPIRALQAGAAEIGAGALDRRIEVRTGDELEGLANQFNDMTARLQESYRGLEQKVEARTAELSEALERQTATSEVLNVISRSTSQLQPVLDAICEIVIRLLRIDRCFVFLRRDGLFHFAASRGGSPEFVEFLRGHPQAPDPNTTIGRVALEKRAVYYKNVEDDPNYDYKQAAAIGGFRSVLGVPLLRQGEVVGAIVVTHPTERAFTDSQVELLTSFADQAVIAVENVRLFDEVQARTAELQESLEQQTATSDVLRVISSSPGSLAPVFEAMLESATRICEAQFSIVFRYRDGAFHPEAMLNVPQAFADDMLRGPDYLRNMGPETAFGQMAAKREPIHIEDVRAGPAYRDRVPIRVALVELGKARTFLAVPMIKDGQLIGAFALYRQEVRAFAPKQIELVSGFASQAVIAIENVRLFDEVQARTAELQESLEQQTATSEVLRVITNSPGELTPVFDSILENATRICEATFGILFRHRDGEIHAEAMLNVPPAYAEYLRSHPQSVAEARTTIGRMMSVKAPLMIEDLSADEAYHAGVPLRVAAVELGGVRTSLAVPMLKEGELIGMFVISRGEVRPFTPKQIDLVAGFASQAAVAIENVRLLNEVQARTRELSESLEFQTATSDVLKAISRSTFDLSPVLDALTTTAMRLCKADFAWFARRDGDRLRVEAGSHSGPTLAVAEEAARRGFDRGTAVGRAIVDRRLVHIVDVLEDPEYQLKAELGAAGGRTMLALPLLRDGAVTGVFALGRLRVEAFAPQQIDLVSQFADQAVIAMENVRLFDEVQARTRDLSESLEQQTATSEVLRVITNSPGQLEPVFDSILENASRICGAPFGALFRYRDGALHVEAMRNVPVAYADWMRTHPQPLTEARTGVGRVRETRRPVMVVDTMADEAYTMRVPLRMAAVELAGCRSFLAVPMLKEDELIGLFVIYRTETGAFTPKQVELASSFASQAAVAIENVRLLNEVQARTRELSESLEFQTATSDVLKAISRSTFDLCAVLDALTSAAMRLCRADVAWFARREGERSRVEAGSLSTPIRSMLDDVVRRGLDRGTTVGRTALERRVVQIVDGLADPEYALKEKLRETGMGTMLGVPLMRDGEVIGVFSLNRMRVEAFTPQQIELVSQFADQAVIAMENVRLFDEVQARTRELSQALERQTATSAVLNVISRSTADIKPVLDAIVQTSTEMCGADFALFFVREGASDRYPIAASYHAPERLLRHLATNPITPDRGSVSGRAVLARAPVYVDDVLADSDFTWIREASLGNFRSTLALPLLRQGEVIGVICVVHNKVRAFTPEQHELLAGFADQAVIAIENVRLFDEVQARTRELSESLEFQTATSDVLKAISRSTFDLSAVLEALTTTAMRLCRADFSWFFHREGDRFKVEAANIPGPALAIAEKVAAMGLTRGTLVGRTAIERRLVHIHDALTDPEYEIKQEAGEASIRTLLGVPLIRDGALLGVFSLGRYSVEDFTPQQIDLVTAFADQAMIAMENVRLFEEVQARTRELAQSVEEMRALGEVSQTVNSTLDAPTVLQTIVAKAVELSGTEAGVIYVWSKRHEAFRMRASHGGDVALTEGMRRQKLGMDTVLGEAAMKREPLQVPELRESAQTPATRLLLDAGYRALLIVPLLGPERAIGALVLRRKQPGLFPDRTVDLMRTFGAQSVVAIQNARLFGEIEEKGRQLELASQHKSQFLANMSHELRTPLNAVLGYAELMADGVYGDLSEKAQGVLGRIESNGKHLLGLINDVLDLSKIEAGQLTLALDDYALPGVVQSVVAATESLATNKGLKLAAEVAPGLPLGRGDERRLTQVLLNVVGNAIKFTDKGGVTIVAGNGEGGFEIAVRDTGPGIAPEHQARIFEEFQQVDDSSTRKKGGSGLGLAISKKIVQMHGGTIAVESAPGVGSTFTIRVPVRVEAQKEIA